MRIRGKYIVSPPVSATSSQTSTNRSNREVPVSTGSMISAAPSGNSASTEGTASGAITAPIDQPVGVQAKTEEAVSVPVDDNGASGAPGVGAGSANIDPSPDEHSDADTESEVQLVDPVADEAPVASVPVVCAATQRVYPALSRFHNVELLSDYELIGWAPWFD